MASPFARHTVLFSLSSFACQALLLIVLEHTATFRCFVMSLLSAPRIQPATPLLAPFQVLEHLESGKDVRLGDWKAADIEMLNTFQLLSAKPVVYLVRDGMGCEGGMT